MKRKTLLFYLLLPLVTYAKTSLVVEPLSGSDVNYAINAIGQIRFEDSSTCLYDKFGEPLGCTPISEINKIVFDEIKEDPTALDGVTTPSIHVYPNPTQSHLIINGLQAEQIVRIYSLEGKLIFSVSERNNSAVLDVSDLQLGDYLLQVGAQIIKFIKQ